MRSQAASCAQSTAECVLNPNFKNMLNKFTLKSNLTILLSINTVNLLVAQTLVFVNDDHWFTSVIISQA